MSVVFRGTVVKCWSQLAASRPAEFEANEERKYFHKINRGKKCNIEKLLIDIENMI